MIETADAFWTAQNRLVHWEDQWRVLHRRDRKRIDRFVVLGALFVLFHFCVDGTQGVFVAKILETFALAYFVFLVVGWRQTRTAEKRVSFLCSEIQSFLKE